MLERIPRVPMLLGALLLFAAARPALARVDVVLDAPSLNEMLSAMAPKEISVPLAQGRSLTLQLQDLKVTGFDPTEGQMQEGFVLTTVRLKVPDLGLDLPLEPRLSLQVARRNGKKEAFLRFEKVLVQLPITGAVDVAPLLPVLPLPTDTSWIVPAQSGNVRVRTVFLEARMGAKNLRLTFDLEAAPAP
jgi:hypothetical protein